MSHFCNSSVPETPNDGGGDSTEPRPINGEPEFELAGFDCPGQDQDMEEGMNLRFLFLFRRKNEDPIETSDRRNSRDIRGNYVCVLYIHICSRHFLKISQKSAAVTREAYK